MKLSSKDWDANEGNVLNDLSQLSRLHGELAAIYRRLAESGGDQLAVLGATRLMDDVGTAQLLTAADLARILRIDQRTLRALRQSGDVPASIRIGTRPRWRRPDVDAWLATRRTQ